jgi:hypothetical protein
MTNVNGVMGTSERMHKDPLLQVWESLVRMKKTHNLKEQYYNDTFFNGTHFKFNFRIFQHVETS